MPEILLTYIRKWSLLCCNDLLKYEQMDTAPFRIYYIQNDIMHSVEIRPCCSEDNVVDYAVWDEDRLAFTLTKDKQTGKWVVALKNADDDIDDSLVQIMGSEIEKKLQEP